MDAINERPVLLKDGVASPDVTPIPITVFVNRIGPHHLDGVNRLLEQNGNGCKARPTDLSRLVCQSGIIRYSIHPDNNPDAPPVAVTLVTVLRGWTGVTVCFSDPKTLIDTSLPEPIRKIFREKLCDSAYELAQRQGAEDLSFTDFF